MERKNRLKELILDLHQGANEEDVKESFKKEFGHVSTVEISQIEQQLIEEGMGVEEIQKLCNVHAAVFTGNIADLHTLDQVDKEMGHPLFVFRKENYGLHLFIENELKPMMAAFTSDPSDNNRKDLMALVKKLAEVDKHYSRKENLMFPYLEKNGITGPTQVMWGKDDEVRRMLKTLLTTNLDENELITGIESAIEEIDSMIVKENDILSPLLLKNIKPYEWLVVADASPSIGYVFNGAIEGASPSDANHWLEQNSNSESHQEPQEDRVETLQDGYIKFPSGLIKFDDMIHMMNTSPQDFTYIDKDDKVRYFSEGKNPVFARTRTIIGRDVRNCHPPKALPVVNQMLIDFKAGTKDEEIRIVTPGTKVLLVRYFAVRNDAGEYIGTLELTEEISKIVDMVNEIRNRN